MTHFGDAFLVKHLFESEGIQDFVRFWIRELVHVDAVKTFLPLVCVFWRAALQESSAFEYHVFHNDVIKLARNQFRDRECRFRFLKGAKLISGLVFILRDLDFT